MICNECKRTYLSEPSDRIELKSLYGLCIDCGTEPQFKQFVSAFGAASFTALLSFEIIFIVSIFATWKWILGIAFCIGAIYYAMLVFISGRDKIVYKSVEARQKATWAQWAAGGISGFGLTWFLALRVLDSYV